MLRAIDKSCEKLIDVLDMYQNCLYVLANDENSLGRFLRDCSKQDKTKAGKILETTGKAFTFSSHQRIQLYAPLLRLYHEIETFHSRAVDDTNTTVDKLEKSRTHYRASLLSMKDISLKLDPDTFRQLEKFRKVQSQVKTNKTSFDKLQLDTFQKIDLLMASRCNLMNLILAGYQSSLLQTFEKNMKAFANAEAVIQAVNVHEYEFKTLKELNSFKSDSIDEEHREQTQQQSSGQSCDSCSQVKTDENGDKGIETDLLVAIDSSETAHVDEVQKSSENSVKSSDFLEDLFTTERTLLGDLSKMDDELTEFLSNKNQSPATASASQTQTKIQKSSDLLEDLYKNKDTPLDDLNNVNDELTEFLSSINSQATTTEANQTNVAQESSDILRNSYTNEATLLGDLCKMNDDLAEFLESSSQHKATTSAGPANVVDASSDLLTDFGSDVTNAQKETTKSQNYLFGSMSADASADKFLNDLLGSDNDKL